jgi:hypothetical protein
MKNAHRQKPTIDLFALEEINDLAAERKGTELARAVRRWPEGDLSAAGLAKWRVWISRYATLLATQWEGLPDLEAAMGESKRFRRTLKEATLADPESGGGLADGHHSEAWATQMAALSEEPAATRHQVAKDGALRAAQAWAAIRWDLLPEATQAFGATERQEALERWLPSALSAEALDEESAKSQAKHALESLAALERRSLVAIEDYPAAVEKALEWTETSPVAACCSALTIRLAEHNRVDLPWPRWARTLAERAKEARYPEAWERAQALAFSMAERAALAAASALGEPEREESEPRHFSAPRI